MTLPDAILKKFPWGLVSWKGKSASKPLPPGEQNLLMAAKLHSAWEHENTNLLDDLLQNPRRARFMVFLTWAAKNYRRGMNGILEDLADVFAHSFGIENQSWLSGKTLDSQDAELILGKVPSDSHDFFLSSVEDWTGLILEGRWEDAEQKPAAVVNLFDLREKVLVRLEELLNRICWEKNFNFSGPEAGYMTCFWPTWERDIFAWMDKRAESVMDRIAETKVSREVKRWFDIACKCQQPLWLNGSPRYGKTETIRALADAYPETFRTVETPDNASTVTLCRAIAEALGLATDKTEDELREDIQWFLSATKITLIFDEAHFLWPVSYGKNTRPRRLDLVRRMILDKGHGAVFVSTPQSYQEIRKKFQKHTGYTIGQWDGRMLKEAPIELPEDISQEEMIEVCSKHLPGASPQVHKYVALKAASVRCSSVFAHRWQKSPSLQISMRTSAGTRCPSLKMSNRQFWMSLPPCRRSLKRKPASRKNRCTRKRQLNQAAGLETFPKSYPQRQPVVPHHLNF